MVDNRIPKCSECGRILNRVFVPIYTTSEKFWDSAVFICDQCKILDRENSEINVAARIKDFLTAVDDGSITLTLTNPCKDGKPEYFGHPLYEAHGWRICVFDDAGEWDYIEWIETPDGHRTEFSTKDEVSPAEQVLIDYQPAELAHWGYG